MSEELKKITMFKDAFDSSHPHYTTVNVVFDRIRTGKASKEIVEKLRTLNDKDEEAKLKKQLPFICFSGTFTHRSNAGIQEHSGYICLDFDHVDARLPAVREKMMADKYTMACFVSPRNNGLKVIVKIPADIENHAGYFEGLRLHYKESTIDDDCEVARGCFQSYDPDIYVNFDSKVFDILVIPKVDVSIDYTTRKNRIRDFAQVYEKIKKWVEKHMAYEDGNKHRFLVGISSACNRFGLPQEITEENLIRDYQNKGSFVKADDFREIVNKVYITYNNQFDISWFTDKGEMNDFNPTGPARDVIYLNDIRKDMLRSFKEGDSKGETTHYKSIDSCWSWKRGELTLMQGIPNHGKALSVDTEIATPTGWTTMGDIKVGDKVFDEQGNVCNVTFVTEPMYNHKCYEVKFNDGTKIIADAEHLWFTETSVSRRSKRAAFKNNLLKLNKSRKVGIDQSHKRTHGSIKTTEEIANSLIGDSKGKGKNEWNHSVPLAKSINLPQENLLIPPYALGCWEGDGGQKRANLTCTHVEIIDEISACGVKVTKHKSKIEYGFVDGFITKLKKMNLYGNKHIPINYLRSSHEQRLELLQGLMDTDGHIDKTGICEFVNMNKVLAENVFELVASLGMKPVLYTGNATLNKKITGTKYRIVFKPLLPVFKLKYKLKRYDGKSKNEHRFIVSCKQVDSVPVKCIQVDSPSKLYLCTKSFIPTHNTTMMLQLCLIKSIKEDVKWGIFSPEQNPPIDFYKDLIHSYIGKSTESYHTNQMTDEEYERGMDFVNDHFFFVYPKDESPTPNYINERFSELIIKHKISGCITDPFNQLDNDYGKNGRDDIYISGYLSTEKRFALINDVYKIIIAHPKGNLTLNKAGNYECPTEYNLAGGAMWANKCDNLLATYRPFYTQEKSNPSVEFRSQKIKKQKYVGIPGTVPLHFDIFSNRYIEFARQEAVEVNGKTINKWVGISPFDDDYEEKFELMEVEARNIELTGDAHTGVKGLGAANAAISQVKSNRAIKIEQPPDVIDTIFSESDDD